MPASFACGAQEPSGRASKHQGRQPTAPEGSGINIDTMPQILRVVANRVTVHDHASRQWCHAAQELVAYPEQILRRLTVKHAAGPDAGVDKT
jgi:hypothetical protein